MKSKFWRNVIGLATVAVVLFLCFGWDWYRPYLKKLMPQSKYQPYIAFVGDSIYTIAADGGPTLIINQEVMIYDTSIGRKITLPISLGVKADSRIAASSDGKIYYVNGVDLELHKFNLKTMTDLPLTSSQYYCLNPACSHRGQLVLFESNLTKQSGYRDIYCLDLKSMNNTAQRLTSSLTFCGSPSFTHNDRHIIYDCQDAAGFSLWIMDKDGKNARILLVGGANGNFQRPACSPVNNWVAYQVNHGGSIGISASLLNWKQDIKRTVTIINDGGEYLNPCWSPDGKKVIFQKRKSIAIGQTVRYFQDIYEADFNPDLPPAPVPLIARPLTTNVYACWLPVLSDSVQFSIAGAFVDSYRRNLPGARNNMN
ncbi:MAG: hypothetical protein PHE24_06405 [Patescibacteria group bacterium]|nr:hypothetical protein [Patescibacteria group bacterium]